MDYLEQLETEEGQLEQIDYYRKFGFETITELAFVWIYYDHPRPGECNDLMSNYRHGANNFKSYLVISNNPNVKMFFTQEEEIDASIHRYLGSDESEFYIDYGGESRNSVCGWVGTSFITSLLRGPIYLVAKYPLPIMIKVVPDVNIIQRFVQYFSKMIKGFENNIMIATVATVVTGVKRPRIEPPVIEQLSITAPVTTVSDIAAPAIKLNPDKVPPANKHPLYNQLHQCAIQFVKDCKIENKMDQYGDPIKYNLKEFVKNRTQFASKYDLPRYRTIFKSITLTSQQVEDIVSSWPYPPKYLLTVATIELISDSDSQSNTSITDTSIAAPVVYQYTDPLFRDFNPSISDSDFADADAAPINNANASPILSVEQIVLNLNSEPTLDLAYYPLTPNAALFFSQT